MAKFEFFRYSNHLQNVISKGVSEPRVFISGRVALGDLVFTCQNKRSLAPIPTPIAQKRHAWGPRIRALKTTRPH